MSSRNMLSLLMSALVMVKQISAVPDARSVHAPRNAKAVENGKAVYMMSNNNETNTIIALPIAQDGTLLVHGGTTTTTGGAGAYGILSTTDQPAGPDTLWSQQSVTVVGNNLFAVNAGSNTVTMFAVDDTTPTKLSVVGSPAAVPGDYPVSVAVSEKHKLVCVGMSGAKAGVSCAQFSSRGIGPMDSLRPFDLDQSVLPLGPSNTISQVFFSDDESTLFSPVKGNRTTADPGFLAAFSVIMQSPQEPAAVSRQPVISTPNGTAVLFGSTPIPGSSNLFVTDASFGAVVLDVNKNMEAVTAAKGTIQGQIATCWVAISPATNTAWVTDGHVDWLVEMSLADASVIGQPVDLSANGDPSLIDMAAAGKFVYAMSPGNGTTEAAVTVVDVLARKQVQHVQLTNMGLMRHSQGMAVLV